MKAFIQAVYGVSSDYDRGVWAGPETPSRWACERQTTALHGRGDDG